MALSLQRQKTEYTIGAGAAGDLKIRMLNWSQQFSIHIFLDSNNYGSAYSGYECLLAAGSQHFLVSNGEEQLNQLFALHKEHNDWLFGHIAYDYKNALFHKLSSAHQPTSDFPHLHFFIPETVCYISRDQTTLTIESVYNTDLIYQQINEVVAVPESEVKLSFTSLFNKADYIQTVEAIRSHIKEGDCYELNLCNKGYCENAVIQPLPVFHALNKLSPAPFAAYYRLNEQYMMCASPERYIRKEGDVVLSQPIKGTARRSIDKIEDEQIKDRLHNDIKERAENVMIVDLVRNDLAHSCKIGTVNVDELFGIYTYPQVHQMISTVSGQLKDGLPFTEAIRHSFPMGSMTGAPKYKVMQLIAHFERANRELFSGSVGYITPSGDFDFNVVIRSLFYNSATQYLYYQTGGAITYDSVPEQEWEEMRLKAWALERIFA